MLYDAEISNPVFCDTLEGWDGVRDGREVQEGEDICIHMSDYYAILFFTASDFISITSHIHNLLLLCFDSVSSFFLELFLHSFPVAYWAPTDLGSSSFSFLSFCLFILFTGFSRQEYWSRLWVPSTVDHILLELSTMTYPSWVTPHCMAHSFIELDEAVVPMISLIRFQWLWLSLCPPSDG